jgi:RNA polymerase sigma factor (sigma-70 family)
MYTFHVQYGGREIPLEHHSYPEEPVSLSKLPGTTRLDRVMEAFGIGPFDVVRTARRIAEELGREDISRQHLTRVRQGLATITEGRIFIIVAAMRELTGYFLSANDLFEVEPPLPEGVQPSLTPRMAPVADGRNRSVPIFSSPRTPAGWRPFVDEDHGAAEQPFESLYIQYGVLLRAIAMREFRVPPDDAEALVHDAFVTYLQRQNTVREPKGWLIGTVRNGCRHYWRDRKHEGPLEALGEEPVDAAAEGDREATLWRITVATAVAQMGNRCREMLRRYYWRGESTADIAEGMATSKDNVWQLLSRCRQRIGEALGKVTRPRK